MSDGGLQRRGEQSAASLGLLLRRSCELRGDQLALVDDERSVGWNEFAGRVARLARGLMQIGMKRGDRVALLSENSARFIEAYFAVPWGGGVIAPINHRLSPLEIADILTDCGPQPGERQRPRSSGSSSPERPSSARVARWSGPAPSPASLPRDFATIDLPATGRSRPPVAPPRPLSQSSIRRV